MHKETKIILNRNAYQYNLNLIKKYSNNSNIIAVIKANAYGHGVKELLDILVENEINKVAVAYIEEAVEIRDLGFVGEILVLVPIFAEKYKVAIERNLEITIQNFEELKSLVKYTEVYNSNGRVKNYLNVQLFLDTGMHRDGFDIKHVNHALEIINKSIYLKFKGILTHFAISEEVNDFTISQIKKFNESVTELIKQGINHKQIDIHTSNSYGIFNQLDLLYNDNDTNNSKLSNNQTTNSIRPGISLHGILSDEKIANEIGLKPTLTLKSNILDIKELDIFETAGYSFRYVAQHKHKVALIPIGYADGFRFELSNKAEVLIKGHKFKVIGSVCMDQIIIDLSSNEKYNTLLSNSNIDNIKVGDEVVIIGEQSYNYQNYTFTSKVTVYDYARLLNTIPYEVFTGFSRRIQRYIE